MKEFPLLGPVQFTSLLRILDEGRLAVTRKDIVDLADPEIISKSKIYNLVNALYFKDAYGIDFTKQFKPSGIEMKQAASMFEEFQDYRNDKEAAEEYELIQNWANDLNLSQYFQLVNEDDHRDRSNAGSSIPSQLSPLDPDEDANQKIDMHDFLENHKDKDLNNAVVMYMISALNYFQNKSPESIKNTAFDIATVGMNGINPNNTSGYRVTSIPDSDFSGYKMLAYYYVSWALSAPEMLGSLQLPFDKEYEMAKLFKKS